MNFLIKISLGHGKNLRGLCVFVLSYTFLLGSCVQQSSTLEVCATSLNIEHAHRPRLEKFAKNMKLEYIDAFVNTVLHINQTGNLPSCYLSKNKARDEGWRPGSNLWDSAPGHSIGGNRFGNREKRLPKKYNGQYTEADLDFDGNRRGAKRLVFVRKQPGKWLMWVTIDHYDSFKKVPRA